MKAKHLKRTDYISGEPYAFCGATPKVGKAADGLVLEYDRTKVTCKRCLLHLERP